jgi:ABC-type Fe3+ transport system permease subunit
MADPDAALTEERRWRVRFRAALVAWAAFAVVVWNVVFDAVVIQSGRDYLTLQALHQKGEGPAVTIPQIMYPGVAHGAQVATLAGGAVAACGACAVWLVARRRRRGRKLAAPAE